ncbi:Hypp358 [Branchiostoma lanceolatum]|uniref:Hypp358 protein n=1 Tax=Branchiostoma lanceolatum TaxID=7740 RepID=A0A8J9YQF8_BRALA|nr:Hypp358 [Branchiostoma lanceolatum]
MASVPNNTHVHIYSTISDSVDDPLSRSSPPDVPAPTMTPIQEKTSRWTVGFLKAYGKLLGLVALALLVSIPLVYVVVAFSTRQSNEIIPDFGYNVQYDANRTALIWESGGKGVTATHLPHASKMGEHLDPQNASVTMNITAMPDIETEEPDPTTTLLTTERYLAALVKGTVTGTTYRQLPASVSAPPPPEMEPTAGHGVDTDPPAFSKTPPRADPQTPGPKPPAVRTMMSTTGASEHRLLDSPKTSAPPKSPNMTTTPMSGIHTKDPPRKPKDNPATLPATGRYPKAMVQESDTVTHNQQLPAASAPPPPDLESSGDPRLDTPAPPVELPTSRLHTPNVLSTPISSEQRYFDSLTEPATPKSPKTTTTTPMPDIHTKDPARIPEDNSTKGFETDPRAFSKTPPQADLSAPRPNPPSLPSMQKSTNSSVQPHFDPQKVPPTPKSLNTTSPISGIKTEDPVLTLRDNPPTTGRHPLATAHGNVTYKGQMTTGSAPPPSKTGDGVSGRPPSWTYGDRALSTEPHVISEGANFDLKQPNTTAIPRNLERADERGKNCPQHGCLAVIPTQTLADKTHLPYLSKILSRAKQPATRPKAPVALTTPLSSSTSGQRHFDSQRTPLVLKALTSTLPDIHGEDSSGKPTSILNTIKTTGNYPPYKRQAVSPNQQMKTDTLSTPNFVSYRPRETSKIPALSTQLPEASNYLGLVSEQPTGTTTLTNDHPFSTVTSHTSEQPERGRKYGRRSGSNCAEGVKLRTQHRHRESRDPARFSPYSVVRK